MAGLAAIHQAGESVVQLLRARRDLMAEQGVLGPVPAGLDISQVGTARLTSAQPPNAGLTICCYSVTRSEQPVARPPARDRADRVSIAVELGYLVVPWASSAAEEHGVLAWAMLELSRYSLLDRSLLAGDAWERDETLQIVPESLAADDLFRIWSALQLRYRLSATFRARVIRLSYGRPDVGPPVVASRFGFADVDPLTEGTP
ncbi:MAG: DUF4255 domain-containing protein [Albimonas sp.]|uniref:DUF4255 domain-containing protein n=1 Tax=Albimonas sp. TaxID=1872425 RepID=UPI0040566BE3